MYKRHNVLTWRFPESRMKIPYPIVRAKRGKGHHLKDWENITVSITGGSSILIAYV